MQGITPEWDTGTSTTWDVYVQNVVQLLPEVKSLSSRQGGVKSAFDLILYLGEHIHGDFYMCVEMCGYHDSA
jgi:hypothetical protein